MVMDGYKWFDKAKRGDPWDVVILGGGPAGAIAARQLALRSLRVLLVEKSPSPRFKACGGCLGGEALDVLQEIGLGNLPTNAGGLLLHRINFYSHNSSTELKLKRRIGLSRTTLDARLLQEAALAGATLCLETRGRLETSHDLRLRPVELQHFGRSLTVYAKAILLATGLAASPSEFDTRSWSQSRIGLATLVKPDRISLDPGVLHMVCGNNGYVGIAPVEDGWYDVAAAVDPAALAAAPSPSVLIDSILREAGFPELKEMQSAKWHGTPLLTKRSRPLGTHRCLLIGDAAEYVEPFTGEGIGWAMRSAVLASNLVLEGLDGWNESIAIRWESLHGRQLAYRQLRCRLISQLLLRSTILRKITLWSLRRAPYLANSFI